MNTVERVNSRKVKTCAQSPSWSLFLAFLNLRRWFTGLNVADSNVRIRAVCPLIFTPPFKNRSCGANLRALFKHPNL